MNGNSDKAISDFDIAIRLKPDNSLVYIHRGQAKLFSDRPNDKGVSDFTEAVRIDPTNSYAVIWLHIARRFAGQDDREELARNASRVDQTRWPGPLLGLYLGMKSAEAVMAAAMSADDPKTLRERTCELDLYVGIYRTEGDTRSEARGLLEAAVHDCASQPIERAAAKAELATLEPTR